jgi:hypothetical protein
MDQALWAAICQTCQFTKSGPTRAEVVFAMEKHSRWTGHIPWEVTKAQSLAPSAGERVH